MCDTISPIREALQEVIVSLLSPDQSVRQLAEEHIQALQVTDDYGLVLTELALQPNSSPPLRQMSAVLLKKYVDTHWNPDSEKFQPPEVKPAIKARIRQMLPHGLKESISKVRSSVAYTIAAIAQWDFPDAWPELFDLLMCALRDADQFAVQGAVRVLKEFTRDLTDTQVPQVAPVMLPDIYRIFMEHDVYTVRTRTRAIEIFTTLTNLICTMRSCEASRGITKSLLTPILPTFTEALVGSLSLPSESHLSDVGLKTEVLKALTVLVKNAPKSMMPWIGQILPPVWSTLTTSADKYVREVVNSNSEDGCDDEQDEAVDSDGGVVGLENLVFAIFEFVHALVDSPKFRGAVKGGLADLMYYIVLYMQITDAQCEKWMENPELFVADEDDDSFSYSVRISSQDLLSALCEEFEQECCVSLAQTIQRHLAESSQAKDTGRTSWWKIHEASMLALGSVQEVVSRQFSAGNTNFDMAGFLQNVVLADVAQPASPYLLGRCLWIGSKFPSQLSPAAMTSFLEATVSALQPTQMPVVRIAAVRAVWGFCTHLKKNKNNTIIDLTPVLPACLDGLVSMCETFNASSEVIGLILENMAVVLACDAGFTASVEAKVTPLVIAIFLKFSIDPVIITLTQEIFKVLAQTPGCLGPVEARLVPTLVSILENGGHNSTEKSAVAGIQPIALEIFETLVRASGIGGQKNNISELMMTSAFPAVVRCTLNSDDSAILQNGGECLRAFISIVPEQVCRFTDADGKSGLWYLVQVAGHLLNPSGSEFTATFVGRLVTALIRNTRDQLGENLDLLLKAVLSKLQGSETLSVMQSLLMVYAQLILTQLGPVLNFLSSVPGPKGESALHFVMTEWVSRQQMFYGFYETKVFYMSLSKLLQHAVMSGDQRLASINVPGEQIISDVLSRTRSQKKLNPDKWTSIPLLAKIFKLLLHEMAAVDSLLDASNGDEDDDEDDSEDETLDEDDNDGLQANGHRRVDLSSLLDDNKPYDDDEDEDDDDDKFFVDIDAKSDPIYSMDLKAYLTNFIGQFCQEAIFRSHFVPHLSDNERKILAAAGYL